MNRASFRLSTRAARALTALALSVPVLPACGGGPAEDLVIESLPEVSPSLPNVPVIPPPPYPIQHADGSYSIYGVRRREATTMDTDVVVTGYIVAIYAPPECPQGRTCAPPAAPHMWIADARDVPEDGQRLMVVGYAENQAAIDEAIENARRGREQPPESETGIIPIPTDFLVGNKVKIRGRFTRVSGAGFNNSEGLLEYRGHETLEAVTPPDQPRRGR
ncbi:MAG: hypothetical protein OHK0013_03600 [Sandaracinaceae bacterium]